MDDGYPTYEIERFTRDTDKHELTILHDDGLYRHLRCKQPGTGMYRFDIVTWPGHLSITGDFGDGLAFARVEDMFTFFRAKAGWNAGRINPQYWAEKLVTGRDRVQKYSMDVFKKLVAEDVADAVTYRPSLGVVDDRHVGLAKAVEDALNGEYNWEYEDGAREFLRDFSYRYEPHETTGIRVGTALADALGAPQAAITVMSYDTAKFEFVDTFEWDLTDWGWSYLWACHAIQWGIDAYDKAKAAQPVAEAVAA